MSSENKHINYSASDIEMYLTGKLSPLEMHALEKAALDDPFLSEAIEGYTGMKDTRWNKELTALRTQVAEKGAVAKVIPLHKASYNRWKTVAAILILGGGIALTYVLTADNVTEQDKTEIAQTIIKPAGTDTITMTEPAVSVTQSLNPSASPSDVELKPNEEKNTQFATVKKPGDRFITDPAAPQIKPLAQTETPAVPDKEQGVAVSPAAGNKTSSSGNNGQLMEDAVARKDKAEVIPAGVAEVSRAQRSETNAPEKKEAVLNKFFTAQVVAADNSPLPFTNISIKKENFGTYADAKGMVRLVSTDSVLHIEVKSVGYLPKTVTLRTNPAQTKIVLQEDELAYMNKTVIESPVANRNYRSNRATLITDSVVNVEPADGWDNYNTYVANNLEVPEDMLKRDLHGAVELSFDVKANGTITNIRVNKSMGTVYDEAARRLIREGPQWKVKKGRKTSANVKVQF